MQDRQSIESALLELKEKYGDWSYDIPLPFGIWTNGGRNVPHTRLKRIVQIASDLVGKPLEECRVLDLGCLDGMFSIEFAIHGAQTVGVEIRKANIEKAKFSKDVLHLKELEFRQDDVRNVSPENYGRFDIIICSGILYHLPARDVVKLLKTMSALTTKLVIIDTHIALKAKEKFEFNGETYWGETYIEHAPGTPQDQKDKKLWASSDNETSFWFSRPSLINLLEKSGFTSTYECFTPTHRNFGNPGPEPADRCTFVGIKGETNNLHTSPAANEFNEKWPEKSLSYSGSMISQFFLSPVCKPLRNIAALVIGKR